MEEDKDFEGGNKVYIRGEIFDHGLFPDSAQITKSILLALFKNLHLVSSIDYKITLDQFKEEATKCIPSLKLTEAHLYFSTFKQIMRQIDKTPDLPENANKADVRCLGVFMATQIYAQTQTAMLHDETRKQYSNTMWPSLTAPTGGGSGDILSSPRSKATKGHHTSSEFQIICHFVKTHLKLFLMLASSDIHSTPEQISLSDHELNSLRILLITRILGHPDDSCTISSLCPLFIPISITPHSAPKTKAKLVHIADWFFQVLSNREHDHQVIIHSLSHSVALREELLNGESIKVCDCEDTHLYIDASVQYIHISSCINCTIMVAAVAAICTLDKCENVTLSVAANMLRVGNSVDCGIHTYTSTPPILYGDNRSLVLGPHNVAYDNLMKHIKTAKIITNTANINNWSQPEFMKCDSLCYIKLPNKDFMKMVLPEQYKENMLMLAPSEFLEVLNIRNNMFSEVQNQIKNGKLSHDQEKLLHVAIQGHFREWIVNTNQLKPIQDLVKMIDQEVHPFNQTQ